ncbi:MAG: DUF3021 domain-containing protein [Spirochaetales bacterium]|nr:DUF3021 domain-containing protein [Spirochaetales bacterium]
MRNFWRRFFSIGAMYAWGGPVVVAIVWLCLYKAGVITSLSVDEAVLGILSSVVLAFIAAGISQIYQIETLPLVMKTLIQCAVLYIDYMGIYLLNGWLSVVNLWRFTIIFLSIFVVIWLIIYMDTKRSAEKMNRKIAK